MVMLQQDSALTFTMPAAETDLLRYCLDVGSVTVEEAYLAYQDVLAALDHCHSRQIVHRDVKCENVLLFRDPNLRFVLSDFGSSCETGPDLMFSEATFSGCYSAPELVSRRAPYDGRKTDRWAAAVVFFNTLCGFQPWERAWFGDKHYANIFSGHHARYWDHMRRFTDRLTEDVISNHFNKVFVHDPLDRA